MRKGYIGEVKINYTGLIPQAKVTIYSFNKVGFFEEFFYFLYLDKKEHRNKLDKVIDLLKEKQLIYFKERVGKNIDKIFVEV